MQRFVRIEENPGGCPKADEEAEQREENCDEVGVATEPLILFL